MKNLVYELAHILRKLKGITVLLHVGLKRGPSKGKVDLLAGCHEGRIETYYPLIDSLLRERWPDGNFWLSDDSVRFDISSGMGGIAIYDTTLLVRQVEEWIEGQNLGGQHRPWATGYWLPEALCGDLATAKTLYDPTGIYEKLKELLVPYPTSLSKVLSELCIDEIKQKQSTFEMLHKSATIERQLCLSDISASLVRLAFARSHQYFRGFRSLEQQTKLLRSSDLPIYELAIKLSKSKNVKFVMDRIKGLQ